jgi:hypothetical protein
MLTEALTTCRCIQPNEDVAKKLKVRREMQELVGVDSTKNVSFPCFAIGKSANIG